MEAVAEQNNSCEDGSEIAKVWADFGERDMQKQRVETNLFVDCSAESDVGDENDHVGDEEGDTGEIDEPFKDGIVLFVVSRIARQATAPVAARVLTGTPFFRQRLKTAGALPITAGA